MQRPAPCSPGTPPASSLSKSLLKLRCVCACAHLRPRSVGFSATWHSIFGRSRPILQACTIEPTTTPPAYHDMLLGQGNPYSGADVRPSAVSSLMRQDQLGRLASQDGAAGERAGAQQATAGGGNECAAPTPACAAGRCGAAAHSRSQRRAHHHHAGCCGEGARVPVSASSLYAVLGS